MNGFAAFLAWPLGVRMTLAALVGVVAGAVVNWVVFVLEHEPKHANLWSRRGAIDASRSIVDKLPLLGWWRLGVKNSASPVGSWLRPFIVEAACGLGFAGWYWWEAVQGGLLHPRIAHGLIAANVDLAAVLHAECFVHLVLAVFMLTATLIDADEWVIPDEVTVPGTLLGVVLLTLFPAALLPAVFERLFMRVPMPLDAAVPYDWPAAFNAGRPAALAIGWGCLLFWVVGLMVGGRWPGLRSGKRRWQIATGIFLRRIRRDRWFKFLPIIALAAALGIWSVWSFAPTRWPSLLTSLLGIAGGALVVWSVRILGSWAFQKEAMGFGDVTLLAMIGAYLGWQPILLVFFAAPIAALVIYVPALFFHRHEALPYGPYLCAATVGVLAFWSDVWSWALPRFSVAWLVPAVLFGGFLILGLVLTFYRALRGRAFGNR